MKKRYDPFLLPLMAKSLIERAEQGDEHAIRIIMSRVIKKGGNNGPAATPLRQ